MQREVWGRDDNDEEVCMYDMQNKQTEKRRPDKTRWKLRKMKSA